MKKLMVLVLLGLAVAGCRSVEAPPEGAPELPLEATDVYKGTWEWTLSTQGQGYTSGTMTISSVSTSNGTTRAEGSWGECNTAPTCGYDGPATITYETGRLRVSFWQNVDNARAEVFRGEDFDSKLSRFGNSYGIEGRGVIYKWNGNIDVAMDMAKRPY